MKDRRLDELGRLAQIVDILYGTEEQKVLERVAKGSLNKALLDLTDAGLIIAEEQKSFRRLCDGFFSLPAGSCPAWSSWH